jgi:nucleoside-diphosphate-sugar epimerase
MDLPFKQALVTGGAGFIGSHLTEALAHQGCSVTVLDNLASGHEANLAEIAGDVRFVRGDIRDHAVLEQAIAGSEVVFHLAAVVSVPLTTEDPLGSAAVNETGSLQVLEAARRAGARRVVFASSSAVYGDDPVLPKREDMAPRPLTPYAVQKLAVEYHQKVYTSLYGLEAVSLRFFNVYGPRQDPASPYSGVISIFMTRALSGTAPVIYGDGLQTRDFVFVGDVAQALVSAATAPAAPGRVFNVGTGRSVSILDLWRAIARAGGSDVQPTHGPARPGDVPHSLSCIEAARIHLQFVPRVDFDEGLGRTLEWYRRSTGHSNRKER